MDAAGPFVQSMKLLIAAGSPASGWEAVVPLLQRAGLEPADDKVAGWLDELYGASAGSGAGEFRRPLHPDDGMAARAAALLPGAGDASPLLADGRNLWLLEFWATRFPQARFLLFYRRADLALAHALQRGAEARRFLEDWAAGNRQLLQFQRRHRRRALLLDADAAAQRPEALIDAARQGGIPLKDAGDWPAPAPGPALPEHFLAACLVAKEGGVEALHAELEASALPLRGASHTPAPGAAELLHSYRQWQDRERELEQRLDDAVGQLQQSREVEQGQSDELARLREDLARAQAAAEAREAELAAAALENASVSGEFAQTRRELEASQGRLLEGELLRQELDAQLEELRSQLEQARRTILGAEALQKESAQDNEMLLTQLGHLHEDLDRAHAAGEAAETALAAATLENARLSGELAQALSELEARQGRLLEGEAREVELEVALEAAKRENTRLLLELEGVRGELDETRQRHQESESIRHELAVHRGELEGHLKETHEALRAEQASRNDLTQENELLVTQLGQLQEEVDHYAARHREAVAQIEARDREMGALGRRLADIQGSLSWRATAPFRALAGAFKRSPDQHKVELKRQVELIDNSGLFDKKWYLAQYGDVRRAGIDPVRHYLMFGAAEGRNPSPEFDTRFYVATYHDVAEAGINPLIHFIKFGRVEGRKASPLGRPL